MADFTNLLGAGSGSPGRTSGIGVIEGLWRKGLITDEQWAEIQRRQGRNTFDTLPKFDLPPAPGFGRGFEAPFGNFTSFEGTAGIDESVMDLLRESAGRDRYTGLIPDQADFEADRAAKLDEIFARAGAGREAAVADLAARGVGGSGEVPRYLARDITAPAVRAAATVSAESQLAFNRAVQAGTIAQEQIKGAARGQLLQAAIVNANLASAEAQFGANLESQERMAANRNALQKMIHDDSITLDIYKSQLQAQLSEYLSHMSWLTATEVARIQGEYAEKAAKAQSKSQMWSAFGEIAVTYFSGGFGGGSSGGEVV